MGQRWLLNIQKGNMRVRVRAKRRILTQAAAFLGTLFIGGLFTYSQNVHKQYDAASEVGLALDTGATSLSVEHHFRTRTEVSAVVGRHLLSGGGGCECPAIADEEWAKNGVAFFIFIVLFVFMGLAVVCDEFFVASLEHITEKLNLSEDVAGATFMAMGSSAPELFTSMMALAQPDSSDSMGSGTIVGSAVFNVLVIIGATGIVGNGLVLDWKPLMRDGIFYALCITLILIFFLDGKVQLYESIILLCCYGLYVTCMVFNQRIFNWLDRCAGKKISPLDDQDQRLSDLATIGHSPTGSTDGKGFEKGDGVKGKQEGKEEGKEEEGKEEKHAEEGAGGVQGRGRERERERGGDERKKERGEGQRETNVT